MPRHKTFISQLASTVNRSCPHSLYRLDSIINGIILCLVGQIKRIDFESQISLQEIKQRFGLEIEKVMKLGQDFSWLEEKERKTEWE